MLSRFFAFGLSGKVIINNIWRVCQDLFMLTKERSSNGAEMHHSVLFFFNMCNPLPKQFESQDLKNVQLSEDELIILTDWLFTHWEFLLYWLFLAQWFQFYCLNVSWWDCTGHFSFVNNLLWQISADPLCKNIVLSVGSFSSQVLVLFLAGTTFFLSLQSRDMSHVSFLG